MLITQPINELLEGICASIDKEHDLGFQNNLRFVCSCVWWTSGFPIITAAVLGWYLHQQEGTKFNI